LDVSALGFLSILLAEYAHFVLAANLKVNAASPGHVKTPVSAIAAIIVE
jgi:hypothetical protein